MYLDHQSKRILCHWLCDIRRVTSVSVSFHLGKLELMIHAQAKRCPRVDILYVKVCCDL